MYIEGKYNWLNHFDAALQMYKNRVHRTTKMTTFEKSFCATSRAAPHTAIPNPILNDKIKLSKFPKFPKFQVGDFVRVPDKRNTYSKGYTTNWNRKLFKVHKINSTNPVLYTLENENKEIIQEKYFEQELLRSIFNFDSNNKTLESMSKISSKVKYLQ